MHYKKDKDAALKHYMESLSMGGTKTLPELYKCADIEFNFSPDYIQKLMQFVKQETISQTGGK